MELQTIINLSIGTEPYRKRTDYTPDQLDGLRRTHTDKSIIVEDLVETKKDAVKKFDAELKVQKGELASTMREIRLGYKEETVEAYLVPDIQEGTVEIYDAKTGDKLDVRKMRPDEKEKAKQTTIYSLNKTGTNG